MAHELETLLREACERGITHLTLYPVPSTDGKTAIWHARGTPSTMHKYVSAVDYDPIKALTAVLLGLPKAPKQRAPKKGEGRPAELDAPTPAGNEITAAVTPEPEESWLLK